MATELMLCLLPSTLWVGECLAENPGSGAEMVE